MRVLIALFRYLILEQLLTLAAVIRRHRPAIARHLVRLQLFLAATPIRYQVRRLVVYRVPHPAHCLVRHQTRPQVPRLAIHPALRRVHHPAPRLQRRLVATLVPHPARHRVRLESQEEVASHPSHM